MTIEPDLTARDPGPEADAGKDRTAWPGGGGLSTLVTILVAAAVLHFGSTVFLPLAIATLLAFALSPIVSALRRRGIARVLAVVGSVTIAFGTLGAIFTIMGSQLTIVVEQLPTFQSNIIAKLDALQADNGSSGVMGSLAEMLSRINAEINSALPAGSGLGNAAPMQVSVVEDQSVWSMLQSVVVPIVSPLVTAGLVIVVVIFMLLEREKLRDRFIRLMGSNDLHRTTVMLEDAGSRVASYLLIQLLVNVIYAVPVGVGLWLIGVPNPVLWGLLTLILRFIPYLGSILAAAMPLFMAFAVSPDWTLVLWTAALFGLVELVTSNFVEPYLYGSRTGLSPLSVIVAAIGWTWVWGPMGLILSTPLTVCLVVLGRYLPQFAVFDILFGDDPVLAAHTQLYQRLLSGEVVEASSRAEETLEHAYLADFYQDVGIPALLLAQGDYDRGVLSHAQEQRIAASAAHLVKSLEPVAADERDAATADASGDKPNVTVAGGRSRLDDVAARMLGQALAAEGAEVVTVTRGNLLSPWATEAGAKAARCLVLCFLDPNPTRASLLVVRRIKRAVPGLRVGVVLWKMPRVLSQAQDEEPAPGRVAEAALRQAEEIGADFIATSMDAALLQAMADEKAKPLTAAQQRPPRRARQPVAPRAA